MELDKDLPVMEHHRSVFSRGLNFQGQCGANNRLKYVHKYSPVDKLQDLNIRDLRTDHSQNILVFENNQLLRWGWALCTRSTYRFIEHYETVPGFIKMIHKFTPFFKSGYDSPKMESFFEDSSIK